MSQYAEIEFVDEPFDAIICLHGSTPSADFFKLFPESTLIAADGAGADLLAEEVKPDYIVGDLDSIDVEKAAEKMPKERLLKIDDQESADFEKCLIFAIEKGFSSVLVVGFHGGELEHTLNNWSIFSRYSKKAELCVYDEGRYGISVDRNVRVKVRPGELISLIPQPSVKLTTKNLRWSLSGETLALGFREGARNRAETGEIFLNIEEGSLLLFLDSRAPKRPRTLNVFNQQKFL